MGRRGWALARVRGNFRVSENAERRPYIGRALPRLEDERLVTGDGRFTDDLHLPDEAHAAFVRSPHAHAAIKGIDTTAARALPDVLAVLTAADYQAAGLGGIRQLPIPADVIDHRAKAFGAEFDAPAIRYAALAARDRKSALRRRAAGGGGRRDARGGARRGRGRAGRLRNPAGRDRCGCGAAAGRAGAARGRCRQPRARDRIRRPGGDRCGVRRRRHRR